MREISAATLSGDGSGSSDIRKAEGSNMAGEERKNPAHGSDAGRTVARSVTAEEGPNAKVIFCFVLEPGCEGHLFPGEEESAAVKADGQRDSDKDGEEYSAARVIAQKLYPPLAQETCLFDLGSEENTKLTTVSAHFKDNLFIVPFIAPTRGPVCARLPGTFRYNETLLQAPCTDYVFEAPKNSCTRFIVSLQPSNASIEITSCAYTLGGDDDDNKKGNRELKKHIPLPGVHLRLFRIGERASSRAYEIITDKFSSVITNITPGAWQYEYTTPKGYQPRFLKKVGQIDVKAGCVRQFHICFEPAPSVVAGQVIFGGDEKTISGNIRLEGVTANGVQRHWDAPLRQDGSYRFLDVETGTYQLRIQQLKTDEHELSSDLFLSKAQSVTVPQSGFFEVPDIHISPEGINDIEVAVTDDSGAALVGEWVELFDRTGKIKLGESLSDSEGKVRFNPNLRGLYYLRLKNDDAQLQPVEVQAR
jgi:hypothetical protein